MLRFSLPQDTVRVPNLSSKRWPGEIFGSHDSVKYPVFLCLEDTKGPLDEDSQQKLQEAIRTSRSCRSDHPRPCLFLGNGGDDTQRPPEKSDTCEICLLATFGKQPYNALPDILKYLVVSVEPNKSRISGRRKLRIQDWRNKHSWLILWKYKCPATDLVEWSRHSDRRFTLNHQDQTYLIQYGKQLRNRWQKHAQDTLSFRQIMFNDTMSYFQTIRKVTTLRFQPLRLLILVQNNYSNFTMRTVDTNASCTSRMRGLTESTASLRPPQFGSEEILSDLTNIAKNISRLSLDSCSFRSAVLRSPGMGIVKSNRFSELFLD